MATQTDLGEVLIRHPALGYSVWRRPRRSSKGGKAIQRLRGISRALPSLHLVDFFVSKAYLAQGDRSSASRHLRIFPEKTRPSDRLSQERVAKAQEVLERLSPSGLTCILPSVIQHLGLG